MQLSDSSKDSADRRIYSVGHSTHSLDAFIALLQQHGITALADVRSSPFSRYNPQYNKAELEREMKARNFGYVFLGRELGARPKDPSLYERGQVQFGRLKDTPLFKAGINRVMQGAGKYRIAMMCAEKDPKDCHRAILVAEALKEHGLKVVHILADGSVESHEDTMKRVPDKAGEAQEDLFLSKDELALVNQEKRVAYTDNLLKSGKRQGAK